MAFEWRFSNLEIMITITISGVCIFMYFGVFITGMDSFGRLNPESHPNTCPCYWKCSLHEVQVKGNNTLYASLNFIKICILFSITSSNRELLLINDRGSEISLTNL